MWRSSRSESADRIGRPLSLRDHPPEDGIVTRGRARTGVEESVPSNVGLRGRPVSLGVLILFRSYGLVATLPIWAYPTAIAGAIAFVGDRRALALGCRRVDQTARAARRPGSGGQCGHLHDRMGPGAGHGLRASSPWRRSSCGDRACGARSCAGRCSTSSSPSTSSAVGLVPSFLGSRSGRGHRRSRAPACWSSSSAWPGPPARRRRRQRRSSPTRRSTTCSPVCPTAPSSTRRTDDALAAATDGQRSSAVMLFDLDRFKEINDTMGHKYGDQVLIEVGPRVRAVLRAGDTLARLGGDEFCVLLPQIAGETEAVRVAERIIGALEEPFEVDGTSWASRPAVGSPWPRRRDHRRPPAPAGRRRHVRGQGLTGQSWSSTPTIST